MRTAAAPGLHPDHRTRLVSALNPYRGDVIIEETSFRDMNRLWRVMWRNLAFVLLYRGSFWAQTHSQRACPQVKLKKSRRFRESNEAARGKLSLLGHKNACSNCPLSRQKVS